MALLPSMPTSFVPRTAPVSQRPHRSLEFGGVLSFLAYLLFFISVAAALGVFFYGRILNSTLVSREAAVKKAQSAIDPATVQSFITLRDRLIAGNELLNNHVAPSAFYTLLQSLLPTTVRFTNLHLALDSTGMAVVEGSGVAKTFNALSAASEAFARDGRIKNAIFSKMTINQSSSVSFSFSATLDPKLLSFTGAPVTATDL